MADSNIYGLTTVQATLDSTSQLYAVTGTAGSYTDTRLPISVLLNGYLQSSSLSASTGSNLVGFTQTGTGAILRTLQAKLRDTTASPRDFGAVGNGSTDDTAAVAAAIAALNAGSFSTLVLDGWFAVNATFTITRNDCGVICPGVAPGTYGLLQQGNHNTLVFQSSAPSTTGIFGCFIENLTIQSGVAAPTSGVALSLNNCSNFTASNTTLLYQYSQLNITGGYAHQWSNTVLQGATGWTTRQASTYLLSIGIGPNNVVSSSLTFSGIELDGQTISGVNTTDLGIIITAGDGLYFSNGHAGFAFSASVSLSCSASPAFVDAVMFSNIYFDGNFGTGGVGAQLFGTGPQISNVKFNSCFFMNHALHGASMSATNCDHVVFDNCTFRSNGQYGVIGNGQTNVSIIGSAFFNNNTANASANAINFTGIAGYRVSNNSIIGSVTFNHPIGLSVDGTSSNGTVTANQFQNCTTPMSISSTATVQGLNKSGTIPIGTLTPSTTGGIVGTTLADTAQSGSVGELIFATGTAIPETSGSTINVTSITLTPGDWEVWGSCLWQPAGTTTATAHHGGISSISATLTVPSLNVTSLQGNFAAGAFMSSPVPVIQINTATTVTMYLCSISAFAVSTETVTGRITARRRR